MRSAAREADAGEGGAAILAVPQDATCARWLALVLRRKRVPKTSTRDVLWRKYQIRWDGSCTVSLQSDPEATPTCRLPDDCAFVIVVCSPAAARSRNIDEQIARFIRSRNRGQVLAVLLEGEPNAGDERECLPPTLRDHEPTAADLRAGGRIGRAHATLQLTAGLMGVSLDALKNRERALRLRRWGYATTGSLLISLLLVGLGLYAQVQVAVAERERARQDDARYKAEEIILYVNTKVSGKLPTAQAESMEVFKVLQRRVGEFYAEVGATNDEAEQRYRESVVLEHESNLALESFEFERSLELMSQAAEIREAIAGRPDAPPLWKLGLADTYASISGMHQYFDRRERAREFLEKAHAIRLALVESIGDPTRLWIYACINSFESLGVMMSQWGEHREAIEHFESADAWLQQLMKNDDEPDAWRGEQASIWSSLATAEIAAGEYSSAMPRLEKVLGIHEELQVLEPAIQEHAFRVAWTHLLLGDAARGARLRKTAMRRYDTAVELLVELSERDPDNFLWHRHVANAFEQRAWLQIDENDFAGARKDFQQARAGWWNSAKLLPSPGNWQMSIKKAESIGEQLVEGGIRADRDGRGTLAEAFVNEALETFAYGARAARHLVDRYPENELFWRDSEIAMELKAIDLLVAWGEPKLAEPRAVAALRFVTELSSREPHDPGWKKVRALCLSRLGRIAALNGELKSAIENHRKALSVLKDLRRADPVELTLQQLAADGCMRIMANLGSADPEQIETIAREVHEVLEDLQQHDAVLSWQQQRILLELNSRTHETGGGDD